MRSFRVYSEAGGNLLAAGMSFEAIFAVFAAVWVGFSLLGIYFNDHPEVQAMVVDFINAQIPGLITTGGPIDPTLLAKSTSVGWTGGLAIVVVLYTAINWLNYTRVAIRKIFGLPNPTINYVLLKIYDLLIALAYGILVVLTAAASVIATKLASMSLEMLGVTDLSWGMTTFIQVASLLLIVVIDAALIAAMIRIISAINIPLRHLASGALLGAVALGIVKFAGALLFNKVSPNPLVTSFAVFLGLLVYFNVASRIFLLSVSWIETGLQKDGIAPQELGWIRARSSRKKSAR